MPPEELEREDKYTVPGEFTLPDLGSLGNRVESETFDLVATYYDTESSHLQRRWVTMRRRTGGHDYACAVAWSPRPATRPRRRRGPRP